VSGNGYASIYILADTGKERSLRRAAKRDSTEPEIIKALEAHGCGVTQLSQEGVPDLICSYNGRWFLVECKSEKGKLTEDQADFMSKHDAWVTVARSKEDVDLLMRVEHERP
jgi:Holliday junction resolvase